MEDNKKWLYDALSKKGYDLGNYKDYEVHSSEPESQKWLYDSSVKAGLDVGSFDEFQSGMNFNNTKDGTDKMPASFNIGGKELSREQLLAPANGQVTAVTDAVQPVKEVPKPIPVSEKKVTPASVYNEMEDQVLDKKLASAKEQPYYLNSYDDIRDHYFSRFSMTDEGKRSQTELAETQKDLVDMFSTKLKESQAYKDIMSSSAAPADKDTAIQALWETEYLPELDKQMEPFINEYSQKVLSRYGKRMSDDTALLDKTTARNSWESIESRINEYENELEKRKGGWKDVSSPTYESNLARVQRETGSMDYNEKARQVSAARSMMERSRKMIEAADAESGGTFVGGLVRGFKDEAFNLDNWTMGLKGLADGQACLNVLEKCEKEGPESLNKEEKLLMDAIVSNAATQAYFQSELGRGYKAGSVTGASLPFMVDMMTGTAAVSASTKAATKGLMKWITKNYSKNTIKKNITKGVTGLSKGVMDASIHTASFGMGRVADDYTQRGIGNVTFDRDGQSFQYAGRKGTESGLGAAGKAFASTALETQSELVGNQFAPALKFVGRQIMRLPGLKNIPASKFGEYMKSVYGSASAKGVREFAKRAQFQGPIAEYAEEVYNNLGSVAIGDMTPEQLVDLDQNIDTFLGVGVMSAAFGLVGTGAFIRERYKTGKEIRSFEEKMKEHIDFDRLKADIKSQDIEGARTFVKQVMNDPSLSAEERKEEIKYIANVLKETAMNSAEAEMGKESLPQEDIEENKSAIFTEFETARKNMESALSPEIVGRIDIGEDIQNILSSEGLSEQQQDAIVDYHAAKVDFEDYISSVRNKVADARETARKEVEGVSNPDMGAVVRVNSNLSPDPVHIVGGTLAFDEEGFVDEKNSSDILYYLDENGVRKMASPSAFVSLVDMNDTDSIAQQAEDDAEKQTIAEEQAQLPQPYAPMVGDEVVIQEGIKGTVTGFTPEGDALVSDGNRVYVAPLNGIMPQNDAENEIPPQAEESNVPENGDVAKPETEQQPSAMQRIPKDEQGNPLYEQADSNTAWDAIVEEAEGDSEVATEIVSDIIKENEAVANVKQKALKKAQEAKPEERKGSTPPTMSERIAAKKTAKEAVATAQQELDQANATLAIWKKIAETPARRKMEADAEQRRITEEAVAKRKAEEEKMRAEREEAERTEREALNGVPDMVDDTPQDARARGYRRVNGHKVDRQEPLQPIQGKEVSVKFSNDNIQNGHVAVVDASQLQPSHIQGTRNPLHFIDEAQPKERNDEASVLSARKIAENIRSEEITSSVTAYTGAPTVNARGEVIQGNSRSDALRLMWNSHPEQAEQYKQYLKDHADEFGLRAEDIEQIKAPVLVNMLDVEDADAIPLGQYVAQDTESGGVERIKPKNALQKMGKDMRSFANLLLKSQDDGVSFSGLVDGNGTEVLKWMNQKGYITPTQYKSAFDSKGNLTAEAKNDLRGIMYQSIFKDGSTQLEEMFSAMPAKAQRAILATAYRDYDSPNNERMVDEVQNSIRAFHSLSQDKAFMEASNFKDALMAAKEWERQYQMDDATGESYLPAENFSNFALRLAAMYKGESQSFMQETFKRMYDLIQGTQEANLFEQPDNTPRTLVQAIKEVLNIDYNGKRRSDLLVGDTRASQRGQQGSAGTLAPGERVENGERAADSGGDIESGSRQSGVPRGSGQGVQEIYEVEKNGLDETEIDELMSRMEDNASEIPQIELNPTNWREQFGDKGMVLTPKGMVKMGANQIEKLFEKGRSEQFGMIKPTLETPQIIVEVPSEAANGNSERESSLLFVKTFLGNDGEKVYYFKSVTVKKDGLEVSISSHYDRSKRIKEALKKGKLLYRFDGGAQTEQRPADVSVTASPENLQGISDNKGTNNSPKGNELGEKIAEAEANTDTNPTEAQKEAGNYKKGHVQVGTFDITIENPKGSVRSGIDADGNKWETTMQNTYGYIRGTEGVDGDHIDVFLSDDIDGWNGRRVFVVDQYNEDGSFDEHKVMLGFNEADDAEAAYFANYDSDWAKNHKTVVTAVNLEDFEKWIDSSHRKTKPFAEYKSVKAESDVRNNNKQEEEAENITVEDIDRRLDEYLAEHEKLGEDEGNELEGSFEYLSENYEDVVREFFDSKRVNSLEEFISYLKDRHAELHSKKDIGTEEQNAPQKNIQGNAPHLLPGRLMKAYESGDETLISSVEQEMRNFVNGADDMRSVYATYLRSKDLERAMEKGSPSNKTQRLIAETCKEALKRFGLPAKAMQSERARTEFAGSATDPRLLDIISADMSFDVLRAIIKNPHVSNATLESFIKAFSNNGLDYEAQRELDKRKNENNGSTGALSTEGDDVRFREAEDRKELIAVHNISEEKLKEALDLGGFPMPSIAITKADVGHTTFGDISLVFDKESINPSDKRNKVYGEDAWTPTFPEVGYKLDDKKTNDMYNRANEAGKMPLFNPVDFHPTNFERHIDGINTQGIIDHFKDDYGAKQLFLSEKGNAVKEFVQKEVQKYNEDDIALYKKILDEIGIERLKNESAERLADDIVRIVGEHRNIDFDKLKPNVRRVKISNARRNAIDYAENGNTKIENDIDATKRLIDERVNEQAFEQWLDDLFDDVVVKKGIRNDKDWYTPSGNSRSWEALYDEITLDNVVRAMQRQSARGGEGLFDGSIFGAAQEEYKSIDEIREAAKNRIRTMDNAEYDAQREAITERLSAVNIPGVGDNFSEVMDMCRNIQDAVARSHTPKGIHKYLKAFYPKVTMENAKEIADIVKDIQRMSARYFEAKPYRAVEFDEVRLAVVPSDTDASLVEQLERRGIEVRTYEKGDKAQRMQIVKDATDEMNLRFRFIGEKGAANMDKAEEATTRLDNLNVAREMEAAFNTKKERIEKLRKSEPIEITGKEVTPSDDLKQYKKNALEYGKKLQGEYTNKDTGRTIQLQRGRKNGGIKEVLQHDTLNDTVQIKSVAAIPSIIENAIYIDSSENQDVQKNPNVVAYHYYVCGLKIGSEDYTVRMVEAEEKDGNRYYDHKLTHIEKGKLINELALINPSSSTELSSTPDAGTEDRNRPTNRGEIQTAPISNIKDKKLVSLLQTNDKESARKIKLATGWERGADGKWRYEVTDGKFDPTGNLHPERRELSAEEKRELEEAEDELQDAFEKGSLAYKGEIDDNTDMADIYEAGGMERGKAERLSRLENKEHELRGKEKNLDDYLDDEELFSAYPKLRNIRVKEGDRNAALLMRLGAFDPKSDTITLNDLSKDVLLHEVQHIIQREEGFANGGSSSFIAKARMHNDALRREVKRLLDDLGVEEWLRQIDDEELEKLEMKHEVANRDFNLGYMFADSMSQPAGDLLRKKLDEANRIISEIKKAIGGEHIELSPVEHYKRLSGEVEARNVQSRMNMTPEERRNTLASETEDVAREDQIFLNDALAESSAMMSDNLDNVNQRFNDRLDNLNERNADRVTLSLGMPSDVLLSAGVSEKPLKLYGNKIIKKMKKHGFKLEELHDLPKAVANPIAVFDNYRKGNGSRSVLTELNTRNGNFLVTLNVGKGEDIDFNIVSSVFGKGEDNVVDWIERELATYINKEKALNYLHHSALRAEALSSSRLSHATKIVESFENPTLEQGKISSSVNELSKSLHTPVKIIRNVNEITDADGKTEQRKRKSKGWFDTSTGEVVLVLPNASSVEDARETVFHEAVAHYGLRKMFGKDFDTFLDNVYANAEQSIRSKINARGGNKRVATEEYLAELAERGFEDKNERSLWQKVKDFLVDMLRKAGVRLGFRLSDNELRYILWKSYQNLSDNNVIDVARDIAKQYELKVGEYRFRDDVTDNIPDDGSREAYEQSLKKEWYKAREAYQDSMLSLKNLQEVVAKTSGSPIQTFENAYMAENQMSSKNTSESEKYYNEFFEPLEKEIARLMKNNSVTYDELSDYMMLKHGIERNIEFSVRDAIKEVEKDQGFDTAKQMKEDYEADKAYLLEDLKNEILSEETYIRELETLGLRYAGTINDYSATRTLLGKMTGKALPTGVKEKKRDDAYIQMFEDQYGKDADVMALANDKVREFEQKFDSATLWKRINAATKHPLKKAYESGLMSKEAYEHTNDMFRFYVPLRGWEEKKADDEYEYLSSDQSPVNSVLRSAKGRRSIPDNPIPVIGNMAESTIMQGNKNVMKQYFLNMAMNHPTDVVTIKKAWYVKDLNTGDWIVSYPDIQENDSAEEIDRKIAEHEERMNKLKDAGEATQSTNGLNINYRIGKSQVQEHIVTVKRNGKDYTLFINGNPRAAQAINGMTNPDVEKNPMMKAIGTANRWLSANFTTRNPAFVLSNLTRDLIFAQSAVLVKESPEYAGKFFQNVPKAMKAILANLNGKGDMSKEIDRYFKEFLENGGETGYMTLTDVDKYKKKIKKDLERMTGEEGKAKHALRWCVDRMEDFNRWAEDVSRFTTYMTSRQMGRSITESVNDAKEITVNFNKKGAGLKTGGFFGISAGLFRGLYLFFNAGVQSLTNFGRLAKKNPVKFGTMLGGFTSAGFVVPALINSFLYALLGGTGDDDPYMDLPEWVRRNNLCIYVGKGKFVTIPLPIELRAFYGLGEMAYSYTVSKSKVRPTEVTYDMANQLTELLPLNPLGHNGDMVSTLMPDVLKPFWQINQNEDFTGKPISKKTAFNELDPEFKRVYKGTSGWLVDSSRFLNEISDGSDFRKGVIDVNPAEVEHLFESYFGGMGKTLNQLGKTLWYGAKSVAEGERNENLKLRNIPVLNRFITEKDERSAFAGVNKEYYKMVDEFEVIDHEVSGLTQKASLMNPKYLKEYADFTKTAKFQWYKKFEKLKFNIDRMYKASKSIPEGEARKAIDMQILDAKRKAISLMEENGKSATGNR